MEIVQLGLFSSIINKVLDYVWDWISDLLSAGFKFLADFIPPVLDLVMEGIIGDVINLILEWYYSKWFLVQSAVLLLLDCIEDCFNVVSGLSPVYLSRGGEGGSAAGEGVPMLFAVFRQQTVQTAFFTMIVVGFSICFFMAILATARSFFELAGEKTKPVTHIIRMTAKSLLYLMLAPLIAFALILMSQAILTTIDRALTANDEGKTSVARIVFCIASLDAVDEDTHSDGDEYNISYKKGPSKASLVDKYRKPFYYVNTTDLVPNFTDPVESRLTFTYRGFDYFIGIGCGLFFTIVMCMILAVFIGRIFDVVVLLIIQPFFVGMMPFDDGEYYRRWFELFLGKLFQGFGSVIGMRVYLMILEQIFSGNIRFSNSQSIGARLQDYIMMLVFAMGGAVAVRHIGPLVTGILSQAAATGEQMTGAAGWAVGSKIAGAEAGVMQKAGTFVAKEGGKALMKTMSQIRWRSNTGGAFTGKPGQGPSSGGGSGDGVGAFDSKTRPGVGGAMGAVGGAAVSGGISKAQKNLSSYKTSSVAGALNNNPSGTGKDRKGAGGRSMQDIVGSGSGIEIEMQDLSGSGGRFEGSSSNAGMSGGGSRPNSSNNSGSRPNSSNNSGSRSNSSNNSGGQSMQDIVGSGNGIEIEMQDLSGGSSQFSSSNAGVSGSSQFSNSSSNAGGSGGSQFSNTSSNNSGGRSMQDIVGSGNGIEIEMQDLSGGSSQFSSSNAGLSGSGSQFGSSNAGLSGGGSQFSSNNNGGQSMQDIVGSGKGIEIEMQDLSGAGGQFDGDDPLNTGFYDPNTGGDDNE